MDSVINQTYTDFECIVVDDHSDSYIINKYNDKRVFFYRRPDCYLKNANSCRNYGVIKSTGKYLIFLDSDDILSPTCLADRITHIKKNVDLYIYNMGKFKIKINDFENIPIDIKKTKGNLIDSFLSYKILWQITSVLWNKEYFLKIGGFDNKLDRFQDFDIHIRALYHKAKIELYPYSKIDCYYRFSEYHQTLTYNKKKIILKNAMYLIQKYKKMNIEFLFGFYSYLFRRYKDVMNNNELLMIKKNIK